MNVSSSLLYLAVAFHTVRRQSTYPELLMGLGALVIFGTTFLTVTALIKPRFGEELILLSSMVFSLMYLFFILRDVLRAEPMVVWIVTLVKIPYFYLLLSVTDRLLMFGSPPYYLIFVPGVLMQYALVGSQSQVVLRSTRISAVLLMAGVFALQLDTIATETIGFGTRFLWHIASASVLFQLISGYVNHGLAAVPARG